MAYSFGWRGPNIIKDGLVLYIDPSSPNSYYDKSSTNIKDISGYGNHGTLTNGPTYNSSVGGNIVLAGDDDYIECVSNTGLSGDVTATLSCWFKNSTVVAYAPLIAIGAGPAALDSITLNLHTNGNYSVSMEFNGGQGARSNAGVFTAGQWTNFTAVKTPGAITSTTTLYINGQLTPVVGGSTSTPNVGVGVTRIGRWVNDANYFWPGNVASALVYNKALTASEVLQNYNATKTRFGL